MTQLTQHFALDEFVRSDTATAKGIDNTPSGSILGNLVTLAAGLEQVRELLNCPMHIDSGYRCPELNDAVGGVNASAHLSGYAADFTSEEFGSPLEIVEMVSKSGIKFDQCIEEGTWVHISFDPRLRQQTLTAHFAANEKTTYTFGA